MVSDATDKASKAGNHAKFVCKWFCIVIILIILLGFLNGARINYNNRLVGTGTLVSENCWVPSGRTSCAPQFIIAGAMKSGTTSIWSYLLSHPDVLPLSSTILDPQSIHTVMAAKEVRFFNDPAYTNLIREYGKATAIDYYLDLFPPIPRPDEQVSDLILGTNKGRITGEATPMYICTPGVAERIKDALPYVKIIITLRNPVDRAYSDYWFRQSLKIRENPIYVSEERHMNIFHSCVTHEIAIADYCGFDSFARNPTRKNANEFWRCCTTVSKKVTDGSPTLCSDKATQHLCDITDTVKASCPGLNLMFGIYAPQLIEWIEVFDKNQILIMNSDSLFEYPAHTMETIGNFLQLDRISWDSITKSTFNIINPKSAAGSKLELATNDNNSAKSLQVGKSDTTSEYPPLDTLVRKDLILKLQKFNELLAEILDNPSFLNWNNIY